MTDSRPRRFDLIAFDWDGTLFDSTRMIARCIQASVVDVGGAEPTEKDAAWVIGLGLAEALAKAAPDVPREKYAELGARYRYHYLQLQDDLVLFLYINFSLLDREIRGYIALIMDLPSLATPAAVASASFGSAGAAGSAGAWS